MTEPPRCPWAIPVAFNRATRCDRPAGHDDGRHEGPGLESFPHQRIEWLADDSRAFQTDRDEPYAWEEQS